MANLPVQNTNEPMIDIYIFETAQNIEQLENYIITCEKSGCFTNTAINEIFRIMHTIKGSSAMMLFNNIAALAHSIEDLFYYLREQNPKNVDCSALSDIVLKGIDFVKVELHKIRNKYNVDGDCSSLTEEIREFLHILKSSNPSENKAAVSIPDSKQQYYIVQNKLKMQSCINSFKAVVFFDDGCEMENIRAYTIIHNLKEFSDEICYLPEDIIDNDDSVGLIREQGFVIHFKADKTYQEMYEFFMQTIFLKDLELYQLESDDIFNNSMKINKLEMESKRVKIPDVECRENKELSVKEAQISNTQSIISVNVTKLDKLMDLVGELVISEAMVTQNPDLMGLALDNFQKASRQLHKITSEIRDTVMSIRMVPLATTFQKMQRIVRDMCKNLKKEVQLQLIGQETEVDKNIIEHISDPLMHLVRNSIDHGIESAEERKAKGKQPSGTLTLEARNAGSDVLIIVKDDGQGFNKIRILQKAKENGLLLKPENEMSDKEIYNLIFLPGFSTKDTVTEFSGRGVGMDVVTKNIEAVGGSVSIDSFEAAGSAITLKIPLTLAIIDGMNIKVGSSRYTIPTTAIKESFRPGETDTFKDPDGNEMIMVRGRCYPIIRLHEFFGVMTQITDFSKGILIMAEQDDKTLCIFADELLGQQQVVVKALPNYIKNTKKIRGLSGCTLLGDGNISLILDVGGLSACES